MSAIPPTTPITPDSLAADGAVPLHVDGVPHEPAPNSPSSAGGELGLRCLPAYARSLLRIKVPVAVTLATNKRPIRLIRELVPGTILQFEKLCDDTLTLDVGGQTVAEGEAVKVGDKFGLRITSMVLPGEHFLPVTGSVQRQSGGGDGASGRRSG